MAKAKPKKLKGRPTKFSKEIQEKIRFLARKGIIDIEIAQIIDINEGTLNNWKTKYPDFFKSLNDWKHQANEKVERSLYERACGYSHPETKAQWVETDIFVEGDWKKVGRWEYAELVKHYPPDTAACIFWEKNRDPERWRDKQEMTVNAGDNLMDLAIQAAKKVMGK